MMDEKKRGMQEGESDKIEPDGWSGGEGCADEVPTRSRAWCGLKTDSS